jgi:hypothetical protein
MSIILRATNDKGQVFDLTPIEDIDLRLDISAIENTEIGTAFGISSQEFAVAGDNDSNQFFGNLFNLGATPAVALQNSVNCQVLTNGQAVFTGRLYISNIVTDQQGYTIYNVVVVNEIIDFKYRIQNKSLTDPIFNWSKYDHTFTAANVTGSWENKLISGSIVYPHVNYGQPDGDNDVPNYALAGYIGGVTLENTIDNNLSPLRLIDFKPAIRVKDVLDVIFAGSYTSESIGYQYTSSFINSDYFKSLYLLTTANDRLGPANTNPVSSSAWVYRSGSNQVIPNVGGAVGSAVDFNAKSYDNNNNFNLSTDVYTAPVSGSYKINAGLTFTIGNWTSERRDFVSLRLTKNGIPVPPSTVSRYGPVSVPDLLTLQYTIDLDAGDTLGLYATFETNSLIKTLIVNPGQLSTYLNVQGPSVVLGRTVNIKEQFADDLKAIDVLEGLIEKFNLVVEPVPNKKNLLSIEPYNEWIDTGRERDWTDKVDRDTRFEIIHPVIEQPKNILFSDEEDDDYLNLYTRQTFNITYGQYTYVSDSDLAEGERKIGKLFAATPVTNIPNSNNFIIPHLCTKTIGSNETYKPMTFKPRLLFGIGLKNSDTPYFLRGESGAVTSHSQYYQVSSLSEIPISGSALDLHYNNNNQGAGAIPPYWSGVQPVGNFITGSGDAFTTYWSNYINGLYDIDARKLTCNVYISPTEIPTIRLNDKIFIDGAYYRINRISGANLTRRDAVEVELIKTIPRRLTFPRRRIRATFDDAPRDIQFEGYNSNGTGRYIDFNTGEEINDYNLIAQAGPLDGLKVYRSGSNDTTGSAVWNYEEATIPSLQQNIVGTNNVDPNSSKVSVVGSRNTVGNPVSTATIMGQYNTVEGNVTNAFVIGQLHTVGATSVNTQILGGISNVTSGSTTNTTFMGGTGSYALNTDHSLIINSTNAGLRDSDFTTVISQHENEIVVNGSGHTVIGLNLEGDGLDLLNTRANSVWLGDTYVGGALFKNQKVLSINDDDNINLSDNEYKHNNLFILDWVGLSPASASITLPNAVNNDYKNIVYTFVTSGSFVGGNGSLTEVAIKGISGQLINGKSTYIIKNPHQSVTLTTSGNGWITLNDNVANTYGAFYSSGSQPITTANAPKAITLNGGWEDYGMYVASGSRIYIEKPGTYQLIANLQVTNLANSLEDFVVWLRFNGNNWPYSSKHSTLQARKSAGVPSGQVVTITFVGTSLAPNDYVELFMAASSTNVSISNYAPNYLGAGEPDAPSVSVMITPIS